MDDKVKARLDQIALQTAELNLEAAEEDAARRKAEKAAKSLKNKQRQAQLKNDVVTAQMIASQCTHRQGASPKNQYGGKGASAIKIAKMPDGFTELAMCAICRLRCFSPHPRNQSPKVRDGETREAAKLRVEKYRADLDRFQAFKEHSLDTLTPEAAEPMDCGTTITVTNEDGLPVMRARPCDSYPMMQ